MSISSRLCMMLCATALVVACDETTSLSSPTSAPATELVVEPVLESQVARQIIAKSVNIDTSSFAGVEGREIDRNSAQVASDIEAALRSSLSGSGTPNADVTLRLTKVQLTSPVSAALLGGPSSITGVLTVTDSATGISLFGPAEIRGNSETFRVPGWVGVVTSPSSDKDYVQTVQGFAGAVRTQLSAN